MKKDYSIDAVLLAGKSDNYDLGVEYKPLLEINKKPMIKYVVDALYNSNYVDNIHIGGEKELNNVFGNYNSRVSVLESKENIVDNIMMLTEKADSKNVFIITSDLPLATNKNIDNFIEKCTNESYFDFCISYFLRDENYYKEFKEVKKSSSLKIPLLKNIPGIKNGCVFMANRESLLKLKEDEKILEIMNSLYSDRKGKPYEYVKKGIEKIGIRKKLLIYTILKGLIKSPFHIGGSNLFSILKKDLGNLIERKTGYSFLIRQCHSNLGVDVDSLSEAKEIEKILKKENKS